MGLSENQQKKVRFAEPSREVESDLVINHDDGYARGSNAEEDELRQEEQEQLWKQRPEVQRRQLQKRVAEFENLHLSLDGELSYLLSRIVELVTLIAHPAVFEVLSSLVKCKIDEIFRKFPIAREVAIEVFIGFRTFGKMELSSTGFYMFQQICTPLMDVLLADRDLFGSKDLLKASFTIYKMEDSTDPKNPSQRQRVFCFQQIVQHNLWRALDLWEGMIYESIDEEIKQAKSLKQSLPNQKFDENQEKF